ncbi:MULTISPECIES: carbohydrate ABC transporter permease [unclassified Microbacterium]|uniref:carbohydrate ABC transporter permease n=1 Tax=unclassified Microbacterium TaxID=2609290 RepID=UPI00301843B5
MTTTPAAPARGARPAHAPRRAAATRPARRRGDLRVALLFIAPAAIGFLAFYLAPALRGIWFSFTDQNLVGSGDFIGIENYQKMMGDPLFWNALLVTLWYVVINIGVQTVLAIGIAVLMHRLTRSALIRGIILLPYLVANVVVALVWFWMMDYSTGIINVVIDALGGDRVAFFGNEALAIPTIALINVWRYVGYTALLIFAGLQTIPNELYEAGALDGASETRMFRSITLPLLRPVLALVLVITVVGSFQIFDTVAVTTTGGPVNSTRVIYYYIYQQAFERFDLGYASAMSVFLLVALAIVAYFQLKIMRSNQSDLA